MLKELYIKNYAIIDELKISFTDHLNIITGETGAGKSILMGALGLILGDRADTSSLLDPASKCIVEGRFSSSSGEAVKNFFTQNDLDEEEETLIRREVSATGKSRAFINDTPVTLTQLRSLSGLLVDLHRQFDIQELTDRSFQLDVLDALAGHEKTLHEYRLAFDEYSSVKTKLAALAEEQEAAAREFDYHQFLFNELEEAAFQEMEIENLEGELKLMNNAENIKETFTAVDSAFTEGEEPLLQQFKSAVSRVANIAGLVPGLAEVEARLQSAYIEIKDIADEIGSLNADVIFNEERLNELNDRLDLAYTLLKKHHVQTTAELLQIKDELSGKLEKVTEFGLELDRLKAKQEQLFATLMKVGKNISENRKKQIPAFTKKVNELLQSVGMPNAAFKVELEQQHQPAENGFDRVEFLFNANKTTFQPIRKVASGGELSRLMLIIKSLVARSMNLSTLIFDEIDTGISGEAARQVGAIIKELSENHQILLITHQAQIAAKAHTHFFVFKEARANKIRTGVRILDRDERIHAIATMLSGEKPSAAAFENARDLMN